jgi:MoaA/NifB/PqqE/SkfB family radical SAM enzyme
MRVTERYHRSRLPLDDVKRAIDAAVERGVNVLSFTGGEPLLALKELIMLMQYAGRAGIAFIRTGTNGYLFMNSERADFRDRVERVAEALAATPLRNFWISIDSAVPAVHEAMRGLPGVIRGIERSLPIFHRYGIYPSANLGINRNVGGNDINSPGRLSVEPSEKGSEQAFYQGFRSAFEKFYEFVIGLGFTTVNSCYPISIQSDREADDLKATYAASSEDRVVRFNRSEKALLLKALLDTVPAFRSRIRIFSPTISLSALYRQYTDHPERPFPCLGGVDFFYINAGDGNTYPCGYRGNGSLGKYWEIDWADLTDAGTCLACDWECFRDPSEFFGPVLQALRNPLELLRRIQRDREYFRLWINDLRYFRACDLFDGRRPPDYERLKSFQPAAGEELKSAA